MVDRNTHNSSDQKNHTPVAYYIPDLPTHDEILPFLKSIDQHRWYSNFGPLEKSLRESFTSQFFSDANNQNIAFTNTGTMAITLALKALKLKQNSKVLIPSLTFPATAIAVINAGLEPVILKTDPLLEMQSEQVVTLIEQHDISAIIPVFYHSKSSTMDWDRFVSDNGVPVIIDACPALGERTLPQHCIMTFSLHATKFFGCGEGGAVLANNTDYISEIRKLSNFSLEDGFIANIGDNGKLSEYHAAVAHAQIHRSQIITKRKAQVASYYRHALKDLYADYSVISNFDKNPSYILIHSLEYPMLALTRYLKQKNIQSRLFHYPDLAEQPCLQKYKKIKNINQNNDLSGNIISLPFHNYLRKESIEIISKLLNSFAEETDDYKHELFRSIA